MQNPFTGISKKIKQKREEKSDKEIIKVFFTGMAMGAADIVPGVSGGTIAFVVGIYEKLIESIKTVTGKTLKLFFSGKIKQSIESVPWSFLVPLGLGLILAVATLSHIIEHLLQAHPEQIWGFFFGLVFASIFIVGKRITNWNFRVIAALIIGVLIGYTLVGLIPQETPATLPAFFIAGAIAICAMILPGVSGSFLLIMMGKYSQVLGAVNDLDFLVLGVFLAGVIFGLALFSRVLSWLFKNYHNAVIAILTGFMIGSLRRLWPWKEVLSWTTCQPGAEKCEVLPLEIINVLPSSLSVEVLITIVLGFVGAAIILFVDKLQETK